MVVDAGEGPPFVVEGLPEGGSEVGLGVMRGLEFVEDLCAAGGFVWGLGDGEGLEEWQVEGFCGCEFHPPEMPVVG